MEAETSLFLFFGLLTWMLQRLQRVHFFRLDSALVNEFGFFLGVQCVHLEGVPLLLVG